MLSHPLSRITARLPHLPRLSHLWEILARIIKSPCRRGIPAPTLPGESEEARKWESFALQRSTMCILSESRIKRI